MIKIALSFLACFILLPAILYAQQTQLKGRVVDETGAGIAEVTVTLKGTNISTKTTADGNFVLSVPAGTANPELNFCTSRTTHKQQKRPAVK